MKFASTCDKFMAFNVSNKTNLLKAWLRGDVNHASENKIYLASHVVYHEPSE